LKLSAVGRRLQKSISSWIKKTAVIFFGSYFFAVHLTIFEVGFVANGVGV
jgi:hypothetical protein